MSDPVPVYSRDVSLAFADAYDRERYKFFEVTPIFKKIPVEQLNYEAEVEAELEIRLWERERAKAAFALVLWIILSALVFG